MIYCRSKELLFAVLKYHFVIFYNQSRLPNSLLLSPRILEKLFYFSLPFFYHRYHNFCLHYNQLQYNMILWRQRCWNYYFMKCYLNILGSPHNAHFDQKNHHSYCKTSFHFLHLFYSLASIWLYILSTNEGTSFIIF